MLTRNAFCSYLKKICTWTKMFMGVYILNQPLKCARPKARKQIKLTHHVSKYLNIINQANALLNKNVFILTNLLSLLKKLKTIIKLCFYAIEVGQNIKDYIYSILRISGHSLVELAMFGDIINRQRIPNSQIIFQNIAAFISWKSHYFYNNVMLFLFCKLEWSKN